MIDNEQLIALAEAEQEPETIELLSAALLAGLLLEVNMLYQKYGDADGLNMSRGTRRKDFFRRVQELVDAHYIRVGETVVSTAETGYASTYERYMQAYEEELGLPLGKMTITAGVLAYALENGYPLPKTMDYNRKKTVKQIRKEMTASFRQKEPMEQAVKRVETVVEKDKERVKVVVSEETARMQQQAQTDSVEDAEEQGVSVDIRWNSMRDNRVRRTHQELHGKKADKDGYFYSSGCKGKGPHLFEGPNSIKENIRCRCYLEARGVNVRDNERWRELNSPAASSARREEWERRRALARERKRGDIS